MSGLAKSNVFNTSTNLDLTVGGHPVDLSEDTHKSQKRYAAFLDRDGKHSFTDSNLTHCK